jgi:hypothetical protein
MSTAHQLSPVSTARLENLVRHALCELKQARQIGDTAHAASCERRMNAMLEQLAKHAFLTGESPMRETVRA